MANKYGQDVQGAFPISGGSIVGLNIDHSTLTGVCWFRDSKKLLKVTDLKVKQCRLYANRFEGCAMMDGHFENCIFEGCEINVTEWSRVKVRRVVEQFSPHVITADFAVLRHCVIINNNPSPKPGVLDYSDDILEVEFNEVTFDGTEFRGRVRPEWFRKCSFIHCRFPCTGVDAMLKTAGHQFPEDP